MDEYIKMGIKSLIETFSDVGKILFDYTDREAEIVRVIFKTTTRHEGSCGRLFRRLRMTTATLSAPI